MAHFIDLRDSGRWQNYYTQQAEINEAVREAIRARDEWARIAGVSPAPSARDGMTSSRPAALSARDCRRSTIARSGRRRPC